MESTSRVLFVLLIFLVFSFQVFSQKPLVNLLSIKGGRGAGIYAMYGAGDGKVLIDGYFRDNVILGRDTLSEDRDGYRFLTWFEHGTIRSSMASFGKILGFGRDAFCIVNHHCISKYDFENRMLWEYTLPLRDSVAWSQWYLFDICFDDAGNAYLLIKTSEKTHLEVKNGVIRGPGMVILKIDKAGELNGYVQFSDKVDRYTRLRIKDNRICAYGGSPNYYAARVFDDRLEEIEDHEFGERCRYSIWDKGGYFNVEKSHSRSLRPLVLEKYHAGNVVTQKYISVDTLYYRDIIDQYELLDVDKRNLLLVYTLEESKGNRTKNRPMQIHLELIRKADLKTKKHLVIDCEGLVEAASGSKMVFLMLGTDLLIANKYRRPCRIGNISFGEAGKEISGETIYIVKQSLD